MGYSPNLGPPDPGSVIGLDGEDTPLLREKTQTSAYRDRDQWPKRVANLLRVSEICRRRPTGSSSTTAAAVAEKKRRRRGERLRARESVMIQMYNSTHHADLDSSLASLRRSFQQCAIVSRTTIVYVEMYGNANTSRGCDVDPGLNIMHYYSCTLKSCCFGNDHRRRLKTIGLLPPKSFRSCVAIFFYCTVRSWDFSSRSIRIALLISSQKHFST